VGRDPWEARKEEFLKRLREDVDVGYLDRRVLPLLEVLNARPKSYTTSSCSGRVAVVDALYPWEREESAVVFKKHEKVEASELLSVLSTKPKRSFWLVVSGPILHVVCKDLEEAREVLSAARRAGFKHSGIMEVSEKGFLVELVGSSQIIMPLTRGERALFDAKAVEDIIALANETLESGWRRVERLVEELKKAGKAR